MIKKIYLVHHTHYDIGFTDLAEEVISQQLRALDEGIRYCEKDPEYHWTIESGSLLRNYLECRPQKMIERLLALLRNGQIEVAAFDMQILTETATFPELFANLTRSVSLGEKFGFPVECVILDDIGGFTGELPRLMNEARLRYFIAGVGAFQTELPWADLPHMFYLNSKSGGRILVWNLGNDRTESSSESKYAFAIYGLGNYFLGIHGMPEFLGIYDMGINLLFHDETPENRFSETKVFQILQDRLEREKYPYEEIMLQYGGDNRTPSPHIAELTRKMNATGMFPEIELTTPRHFFHVMEQKYSGNIPEIKGLLTDPWNLRINAVPSVLKKYRWAQRKYDALRLRGCQNNLLLENLMLLADHTFGLNNWGWQKLTVPGPEGLRAASFDRLRQSWQCKASYADSALRQAFNEEHRADSFSTQCETEYVVIRNNAEHVVSGSVELYLGSYAPHLISLKDNFGCEVPRQCIGLNRWMLYVEQIPALGTRCYIPLFSEKYDMNPNVPEPAVPGRMKTDFFTFEFEPDGSLQKLSGKDGKVFSDMTSDYAMGEILCEELHDSGEEWEHCGLRPSVQRTLLRMMDKSGKLTEDGELFLSVQQSGRLFHAGVEIRIRIWKHLPRIDFMIRLDQQERPEKSCFYTAFPLSGKQHTFRFDQNIGIATLPELLPGAMQDLFYCSRYASLENGEYTAILCCPDAPVVEFGGLHTAQWRKKLPFTPEFSHIYGLLCNNICNTDAPAWFPILETFEYSLFLKPGTFDPAFAHDAWESCCALSGNIGFEEEVCGLFGIPKEIRVHSDENGQLWMENPSSETKSFSFTKNQKTSIITLKPFELKKV